MKNPFKKQDNTVLIGAIAAGALIAGGAAWLLLTEKGSGQRERLTTCIKEKAKELAASFIAGKTGVSEDVTKAATDAVAG